MYAGREEKNQTNVEKNIKFLVSWDSKETTPGSSPTPNTNMLVTLPLDENLSPRSLAALFAKRQRGGDKLKSLIAPTTNEFGEWRPAVVDEENVINNDSNNSPSLAFNKSSSLSTLMKKEKKQGTKQPKNHLKANREALKSRALANKNVVQERKAKEELQLQKRDREKQKLFGNVRSKIFDPNSSSSSSPSSAVSSSNEGGGGGRCHSAATTTSSTAPSSSSTDSQSITFGTKIPANLLSNQTTTTMSSVVGNTVSSSPSISGRHKSYGKIPKYISDRKARIEQEARDMQYCKDNAPPKPGLVLLQESDRLDTLHMLERNEQEARKILDSIPFRMNEQRATRIRQTVEYRLAEIEETRKMFSVGKVFVTK